MTDESVADATLDDDALVELADKPREATPYERKLRNEAAKYHKRALDAERSSAATIAKFKADTEAEKLAFEQTTRDRLMRADLRHHAVKHGLMDLDTLKLFDLSKAEANVDGEVTNAETLFEQWKASKPHFFGSANTASTASPPRQTTAPAQTVGEMSEADLQSFRRAHGLKTRS